MFVQTYCREKVGLPVMIIGGQSWRSLSPGGHQDLFYFDLKLCSVTYFIFMKSFFSKVNTVQL